MPMNFLEKKSLKKNWKSLKVFRIINQTSEKFENNEKYVGFS